jgi:protein phosphatase-4 regulatory subunit 3
MATITTSPIADRKRVKVYELKNNDWFDRGTGFCTGSMVNVSFCYTRDAR